MTDREEVRAGTEEDDPDFWDDEDDWSDDDTRLHDPGQPPDRPEHDSQAVIRREGRRNADKRKEEGYEGGADEREERVKELLDTEEEYLKDLTTLLYLADLASNTSSSSSHFTSLQHLDLCTLLGNLPQVVEVSRDVAGQLRAGEGPGGPLVGHVFLPLVPNLCHVYQEYCASYSTVVLPLLKKYNESEEGRDALRSLAGELQSRRPHLFSIETVLIKPVQRILKYPLLLREVLRVTDDNHPDRPQLHEACDALQDAARRINEYTRGIDLVHKYNNETEPKQHDGLERKMKRLSLHTLARKSSRASAIISHKLGILHRTASCHELEDEAAKLREVAKGARVLSSQGQALREAVRTRHVAELGVAEALLTLLPAAPYVETLHQTALSACNNALSIFDREVERRVVVPATQLVTLCKGPEQLIDKWHRKWLDREAALTKQHVTQRLRHDSERGSEEEDRVLKYEALTALLMTDLPVLTKQGREVLVQACLALANARLYLQGRLAKLYLRLTEVPMLGYLEPREARRRVQQQQEQLRALLPPDLLGKHGQSTTAPLRERSQLGARHSLTIHGPRHLHTLPSSATSTVMSQVTKRKSLPGRYLMDVASSLAGHPFPASPASSPPHAKSAEEGADSVGGSQEGRQRRGEDWVAKVAHKAVQPTELNLAVGEHVQVLRRFDPTGDTNRWIVSDGERMGLVPASCLREATPSHSHHLSVPASDNPQLSHRLSAPPSFNAHSSHEVSASPSDTPQPTQQLSASPEPEILNPQPSASSAAAAEVASINELYVTVYPFVAEEETQLSVDAGQVVQLLSKDEASGWWYVLDSSGTPGYLPGSYLAPHNPTPQDQTPN